MSAVAFAYLEARARAGKSRETIRHNRSVLQTLLRFIRETRRPRGELVPGLLSEELLDRFVDWLRDKGRSDATIFRYTRLVEQWWAWAATRDAFRAFVPPPTTLDMSPPLPKPVRSVDWAQVDAAIAVALERSAAPWVAEVLTVARATGLRWKQIWHMAWPQFTLGGDVAWWQMPPELGKTRTEKGAARVVPLAPWFADWLRERRRAEGYVVQPERVRPPVTEQVRVHRFPLHRAWRLAGVDEELTRRRPLHVCRRAMETGLTMAGAERIAIDYLLGHDLGGIGANAYLDPNGLRPKLLAAVGMIPPVGQASDIGWARTG